MSKKIMSKIVSIEKQELSAIRVDLNFQQDIQKFVDEVFEEIDYSERINKEMDAAWVKTRNAVQELTQATQEVKNHLSSLDVKSDAKSLQDKVKAASAELGVKPTAVKGYDDIDVAVKEATKQAQNARANIKDSKIPKG
jgi:uncharacterized protein YhaN